MLHEIIIDLHELLNLLTCHYSNVHACLCNMYGFDVCHALYMNVNMNITCLSHACLKSMGYMHCLNVNMHTTCMRGIGYIIGRHMPHYCIIFFYFFTLLYYTLFTYICYIHMVYTITNLLYCMIFPIMYI